MGFEGMSYQGKLSYLARMQAILIDKITIKEMNRRNHPSTVNLTISLEEEEIIRIMFGASVRSGRPETPIDKRSVAAARTVQNCVQNCVQNWFWTVQYCPIKKTNWTSPKPIIAPEGNAWAEKQLCHLVLQNDRPKIWKNEDDASVCQVSASDEGDGVQGYRNNLPTIVETIMNSNRCYIANSLGFKLYDEDQEDYISYIKEELIGFIEEIVNFGFDHIIIIGELNYGMLFLDCFGRVFDFDAMTCTVLFLGDCSERIKRVTKRLKDVWVQWIVDSDEGKIVEANGPEHYLIPFRKKQIEKKPKKKKKKKGSGKKHH
ncbi:hypothetical protein RclHR1_00130011 [Rhizophagus clarus]|uniref:Uncharacterized protein n=1 Tax=Rhizophagus clarus TaxID=94130 RepID=A0A2Z6Q8Q0_9GLOM|nr:hypothetical protein RclHR1_00130011 [Rhizophagus clarus]